MDGITNSVEILLSKIWEMVKGGEAYVLQSMGSESVTTKRLNNKTNPYFPPLNAYRIWHI